MRKNDRAIPREGALARLWSCINFVITWGLLGGSRKNPRFPRVEWITMARRDGFEPATASFEDSCSIQLSYRRAPFLF